MRIRPESATGDYTLGQPFLVNSPQAVALLISNRLSLWQGEWFADTSDGTPYLSEALGEGATRNPDAVIKQRILTTPGVTSITAYSSSRNPTTRKLTVAAEVQTEFGSVTVSEVL